MPKELRAKTSFIWKGLPSAQPQQGDAPDRLGDDRAAHLRRTGLTIAEDDRHLDDIEAALDRAVGHLDLEGVTARLDRVEVDRLQHLAAGSSASAARCWR